MDTPILEQTPPQTAEQINRPQTGQIDVAPPPAAAVVIDGEETETVSALRERLKAEQDARKKAETDAAYAQDEARRLKEVQTAPPQPKPRKTRWTFFHEED